MSITQQKLFEILIIGRTESFLKKDDTYNPYKHADLYDWHFEINVDSFLFTDSYRGYNPYSGVEYVYETGIRTPLWQNDYVGYAALDSTLSEQEIYCFLKKGRSEHFRNSGGIIIYNYHYAENLSRYETTFRGDINTLLQVEEIYHKNKLIARQVSSSRLIWENQQE